MPSPFPGMDPYLESPRHWEGAHQLLISAMTAALNAVLPPEFMARVGERVYVLEPEHVILPDVAVLQRNVPTIAPRGATAVLSPPAMAAAAGAADMPLIVSTYTEEVREAFIDIVALRQGGRVVTAIELLSPANKVSGAGGTEYSRKRRQVLGSRTHLLEIDLLRGGGHSVAASRDHIALQRSAYDYLVCLHRANSGQIYEVWPWVLRDRLPRVYVPLTEEYSDEILDLRAALDRVYDEGAFGRGIDYAAEPDPPLRSEDTAWADALLREKGLRP